MARFNLVAGSAALIAAFSMAITPAAAADVAGSAPRASLAPVMAASGALDFDSVNADGWRRYHRRDRGVDAGDVLAGVLIIGGIAAIANAASRSNDRYRSYPDRDYRYPDTRYPNRDYRAPYRGDSRYDDSRGIDRAVSLCVAQVERDARVDTVDTVDRSGNGWRVTGALYNGERFTCRIGNDGRVDDIDYGAGFSANTQDRQYDDDRYRSARAQVDGQPGGYDAPRPDDRVEIPAYPGGPVGSDAEVSGDDGRYSSGSVGDFET